MYKLIKTILNAAIIITASLCSYQQQCSAELLARSSVKLFALELTLLRPKLPFVLLVHSFGKFSPHSSNQPENFSVIRAHI